VKSKFAICEITVTVHAGDKFSELLFEFVLYVNAIYVFFW